MNCEIKLKLITDSKAGIGPGLVNLLENIRQTSSIAKASENMQLSYSKARKILKRAETDTKEKLLNTESGGAEGGKSTLTDYAVKLIEIYRQIEKSTISFANKKASLISEL